MFHHTQAGHQQDQDEHQQYFHHAQHGHRVESSGIEQSILHIHHHHAQHDAVLAESIGIEQSILHIHDHHAQHGQRAESSGSEQSILHSNKAHLPSNVRKPDHSLLVPGAPTPAPGADPKIRKLSAAASRAVLASLPEHWKAPEEETNVDPALGFKSTIASIADTYENERPVQTPLKKKEEGTMLLTTDVISADNQPVFPSSKPSPDSITNIGVLIKIPHQRNLQPHGLPIIVLQQEGLQVQEGGGNTDAKHRTRVGTGDENIVKMITSSPSISEKFCVMRDIFQGYCEFNGVSNIGSTLPITEVQGIWDVTKTRHHLLLQEDHNDDISTGGLVQPVTGLPHHHHCPKVASEDLQAGGQLPVLEAMTSTTKVAPQAARVTMHETPGTGPLPPHQGGRTVPGHVNQQQERVHLHNCLKSNHCILGEVQQIGQQGWLQQVEGCLGPADQYQSHRRVKGLTQISPKHNLKVKYHYNYHEVGSTSPMETVALAFIQVSDTSLDCRDVVNHNEGLLASVETRISADKQHQPWHSTKLVKGHIIHQAVAHHEDSPHLGQLVPQQPMVHEVKQVSIMSSATHSSSKPVKILKSSDARPTPAPLVAENNYTRLCAVNRMSRTTLLTPDKVISNLTSQCLEMDNTRTEAIRHITCNDVTVGMSVPHLSILMYWLNKTSFSLKECAFVMICPPGVRREDYLRLTRTNG